MDIGASFPRSTLQVIAYQMSEWQPVSSAITHNRAWIVICLHDSAMRERRKDAQDKDENAIELVKTKN